MWDATVVVERFRRNIRVDTSGRYFLPLRSVNLNDSNPKVIILLTKSQYDRVSRDARVWGNGVQGVRVTKWDMDSSAYELLERRFGKSAMDDISIVEFERKAEGLGQALLVFFLLSGALYATSFWSGGGRREVRSDNDRATPSFYGALTRRLLITTALLVFSGLVVLVFKNGFHAFLLNTEPPEWRKYKNRLMIPDEYRHAILNAAKTGDAHAKFLASGLVAEPEESERLLREAAQMGHIHANFEYGVFLYRRRSEPDDNRMAVKYWRVAAERGDAESQAWLAWGLEQPLSGVLHDPIEASKWWRAASDQGHVQGHYRLAHCYLRGVGVPQNFEQAYILLSLAAAQGLPCSTERD
jgi:hypothetical protein